MEETSVLTSIWPGRNEICYKEDDHNCMSSTCAKEFLDLNFDYAVIGKISIFFVKVNCPKFYIFTIFLKIITGFF